MTRRALPALVIAAIDDLDDRALEDDCRALRALRAQGVGVGIVTARDFAAASRAVLALGIDAWIVAADGAYVGRANELLARRCIPGCDVGSLLELLAGRAGVAGAVIDRDGAHRIAANVELPRALLARGTDESDAAPAHGDCALVLATGPRDGLEHAARAIEREPRLELARVALQDTLTIRVRSRRGVLGRAIAALATRVGARAPTTVLARRTPPRFDDPTVARVTRFVAEGSVAAAIAQWHARRAGALSA